MLRSALFGAITVTFIREIMCQWWLSTLISHQVSRDILYSRCLRLWWLLLSVSLLRIRTVDWSMNYQLVLQSLSWLTETGWIRSYSRVNVLRNITCPQTLPEHRTLTWHVNERVFTGTSAFLWFFRSLPSVSCKVSRRVFLFIGSKGSFFGNFSLDYKVVIEKRSRKTNESSCGTENYRTKLTFDKLRSCTWICELENKL